MKAPWVRLLAFFAVWLFAQAALFPLVNPPEKKQYTIQKTSKLYLKGTSNVNSFTCTCEERYGSQVLDVESSGKHAKFKNTRLRMTTRKFNCKNAKIDRDMHKALKATEYEHIVIELLETWYDPEHFKNGNAEKWSTVKAKVKLTITNVSKEQTIQAVARKKGENRFELRGEKALNMSEYGIDPPEALFGLIKVDDLITFHFELDVSVEDVVEEKS